MIGKKLYDLQECGKPVSRRIETSLERTLHQTNNPSLGKIL